MNEYKTETEKQPASRGYVVCCVLITAVLCLVGVLGSHLLLK